MKIKLLLLAFFVGVAAFFFYKTAFLGKIPFPGDLLIAEYSPWKQYSILGYNPGSFPNKAQYFDVVRQLYPWKTFTIDLLKSGQFPLWNPYNFSGSPLFANSQSAVLYPLSIFYFFFPQVVAWSLLVVLQPLLAGLFTYLYSRQIRMGSRASIFAATTYSYCLFMSVFLEYNTVGHVILWLPLILFSIEKIIEKLHWKYLLVLIVALSAAFTAGHIQIFGFLYLFSLVYGLIRLIGHKVSKQKILILLISFVLPIGIVAILLFPLLELISNAARSPQEYNFLVTRFLFQPYQLLLFFAPDIFGNPATGNYAINFDQYPGNAVYVGIIPLLFSFFSIQYFKNNFFVKIFSLFSLIFLALFIRSPFTELFYKMQIPFFSTGSPTNAIFLLSFSFSILAGLGMDYWLTKKVLLKQVLFGFVFLFGVFWGFFIFTNPSIILIRNLFLPTTLLIVSACLLVFSRRYLTTKKTVFIVILCISIFDSFYYFQKFNPFVAKELVFPQTKVISYLQQSAGINRIWGYGSSSIDANFHTHYGIFSADGYDPLYPKEYGVFIQSSRDGILPKTFTNQTRSDAVVAPGYGEEDLPTNINRLKVLSLLGVKYILASKSDGTTEKTFPSSDYKEVYSDESYLVFENLKSLPRFYLANNFSLYDSSNFGKIFFAKDFDPQKTILLQKEISGFRNNTEAQVGTAALKVYSPNKISITTNSQSENILFLSDTYYPGWEAYIDGQKTEILKAFYSFRAVVVPSGNHTVSFIYNPAAFDIGRIVSIISIGITGCFIFAVRKFWYEKK
jgi:uncharacterized membrane protein YfhO